MTSSLQDMRKRWSPDPDEPVATYPDFVRYLFTKPGEQFQIQWTWLQQRLRFYFREDDVRGMLRERWNESEALQDLYGIKIEQSMSSNAQQIIKTRWIRDGIWNPNWDKTKVFDKWAHEEADPIPGMDTEASRPHKQFELQVAAELEWLKHARSRDEVFSEHFDEEAKDLEEKTRPADTESRPPRDPYEPWYPDFQKVARENVRRRWVWWDIWDPIWGLTPGRQWAHERYDLDVVATYVSSIRDTPGDPEPHYREPQTPPADRSCDESG